MPWPTDPNLLVGFETSDDAAVYRLSDEVGVVSTTDFITPPVDDPVWFGRIAAANSLSDVYAMGGRPLMALNLVMFPIRELGPEVLRSVLAGGAEKVGEAGAALAGGHSVEDPEPKYGLAVTGVVHPARIWTNCRARPGDALVLTKPIGTGVLFNACRSGKLPWPDLEPILSEVAALNRTAMEAASEYEIHSCTDVTGFGLAGHAFEMAKGSGVRLEISFREIPVYPHAGEMYARGETTGSNGPNRKLVEGRLDLQASFGRPKDEELLFDPQTSGGLLLALPEDQAESLVLRLRGSGVESAGRIGYVAASAKPGLRVV